MNKAFPTLTGDPKVDRVLVAVARLAAELATTGAEREHKGAAPTRNAP